MNNQAILCARVSSKEQSEKGGSLEAQIDLLRKYAKKKNFSVIKEFSWDESAGRIERKKFDAVINFAKDNGIPHILFEKTDRYTRRWQELVATESLIREHDKILHFVKENITLHKDSSSHDMFIFGIKAQVAKLFRDNLSEETTKGLDVKVKYGFFPRPAPIGYLNNGKSVKIIDEEKAPLIKWAFEEYSKDKHSLKSLAEQLKIRGLKNKNRNFITKHGLETILKNQFYYGYFDWKGEFKKGAHEPIITKELFDRVQSVFAKRNNVGYSHPTDPSKRFFPFKGLLKCGYCGCSITSEIKKEKFIYYRCSFAKGNAN